LVVSTLEVQPISHKVVYSVPAQQTPGIFRQPEHGPTQLTSRQARKRSRPRLSFDQMGIPVGSVLKSVAGRCTVRVKGPHTVSFEGLEMSLSEATRKALGRRCSNPCPKWTFNDKSVGKIYDETYGPV
jgi:hypothetical protein